MIPVTKHADGSPALEIVLTNNTYQIHYAENDQIELFTSESDNAIWFSIQPISAKYRSENFMINDGPIKTTGELEADIFAGQIIVGLTTNTTVPNRFNTTGAGKLLPVINPWGVQLYIDRKMLKIRIDDSIFANYIELITEIVKQPLCDVVEQITEDILNENIIRILNSKILARDGARTPWVT